MDKEERLRLIDKLSSKYGSSAQPKQRWLYYRKKYSWLFVIAITHFFKRFFDILISILLLIVLSPLMLIVALMIKLIDGGPVFFIGTRVGKWGKEFQFPKFRTMHLNAHSKRESLKPLTMHKDEGSFKIQNDPRTTKLGYYLRKSSLDELPQLWCVLKGEMSLVGPRPPLPEEVACYTPHERARLEITPGLTCLWQVSGRSNIPFSKQVQLDREYIESQSLWLDIKILLKTIPAVLFGRGAY